MKQFLVILLLFWTATNISANDYTNYSYLTELFPTLGKAGLQLNNCKVMLSEYKLSFNDGPDIQKKDYVISNGVRITLPFHLHRPVDVEGKKVHNKANVYKIESEGFFVDIDITTRWNDSGGYYDRAEAKIFLDKDKNLLGFSASKHKASRWFLFFGPMSDFKQIASIKCGKQMSWKPEQGKRLNPASAPKDT